MTLVAFIVAATLQAYNSRLKSVRKTLESVPAEQRLEATKVAAEYINVNTSELPAGKKFDIVMQQLRLKEQRQWQVTISALVVAFLLSGLTLAAILRGPTNIPSTPPAPSPDPAPTVQEFVVCNVDVDNVDKCPPYDFVRHIGHSASQADIGNLANELCPQRGLKVASPYGFMRSDRGGGQWGVNEIVIRCEG